MKLKEIVRRPGYTLRRIAYKFYELTHPDEPWISQEAIHFCDKYLTQDQIGLEWGSGRSTAWFGTRLKSLLSIEFDILWHSKVVNILQDKGIKNVECRTMITLDKITAIVPRLPPSVDGLGDYGLNLARQLRQDFGLETEFIVGDQNEFSEALVEGFPVKQVAMRSRAALLELLPKESDRRATVLLHYVGYGYAKRGCPVWLVEALEDWRKGGDRYLVTMFHELYAFGPIWTSQFWTSPLQRNLAARLVRVSDRCLTSKQGYAEIIAKFSQGKQENIPVLPVFSNVGEPENLSPLVERLPRLVVFGGRGPRSRVYMRSHLALERTCRDLEIEEILDIGPDVGFKIKPVHGITITCLGIKMSEEISSLLANSRVGFFDYHPRFLAKSTIFAAYCAHKLLPVGGFYAGENLDGLVEEKHYWWGQKHSGIISWSLAQMVADNAYNWYQSHRLSVQAKSILNLRLSSPQ